MNYQVTVDNSVARGTELINGASIYDNVSKEVNPNPPAIPEACAYTDAPLDLFPNCTEAPIIVTKPDLKIDKTAPYSVLPGETFLYTLKYSNINRETAFDAYIIEKLPDIALINVIVSNGEVVYYATNASLPIFDPTDPTGSGDWSATKPATGTTFVAITLGDVGGFSQEKTIQMTV